jgi:hypothetical protein
MAIAFENLVAIKWRDDKRKPTATFKTIVASFSGDKKYDG